MMRKGLLLGCLSACLVLLACPSGPSSSGPDRASDQDQAATLKDKLDLFQDLLEQRHAAGRVWDELMTALPDRVWLTGIVYDSEGIEVKGRARTNNLLADYVSRLERQPGLTQVMLLSSVQKQARNIEFQEFALRALADPPREEMVASLEELEKAMPARNETSDMLRQVQQLASDSRLNVTKFVPGNEIQKDFYSEWPVAIEVTGTRQAFGRFLGAMAELPRLWLVSKFSVKAVSDQDVDSPVRASITAITCFLRE